MLNSSDPEKSLIMKRIEYLIYLQAITSQTSESPHLRELCILKLKDIYGPKISESWSP